MRQETFKITIPVLIIHILGQCKIIGSGSDSAASVLVVRDIPGNKFICVESLHLMWRPVESSRLLY